MLQRLEQKLLRRKELGSLRTIDLAPLAHTDSHKHRERADFSSNDYLGLARSRPLFRRVEEDYARYVLAAAPSEPILGAGC
jgi:7-keto-8-aminopelargonate synthetase-like enzyme